MNLLFLSSGPNSPSSRYRILPYVKHFRAEGHRCAVWHSFPEKYDYFPWIGFRPSQLLKRGVRWWHWLRAHLQRFDLVYIDREIFDAPDFQMEERFRGLCRRLVLDLDDAVFLRYPEKFRTLIPMADLVVCGNRFLADFVRPLNSRLCEIPTGVELDDYPPKLEEAADSTPSPLKVGWIGTSGNLPNLAVVAPALRILTQEFSFELHLVVDHLKPLAGIDLGAVRVVHHPWSPRTAINELRSFHIGIMPLADDQGWNHYKCGLKLIEYLAVGLPAIASPVGVNVDILDQQKNGFAAATTEDWLHAFRRLMSDPALRQRMGQHGRATVSERYSIKANYPPLRDALLQMVAGGDAKSIRESRM